MKKITTALFAILLFSSATFAQNFTKNNNNDLNRDHHQFGFKKDHDKKDKHHDKKCDGRKHDNKNKQQAFSHNWKNGQQNNGQWSKGHNNFSHK